MNLLEMDIREYVLDIIDVFVEVAGEEYRSIIKERFGRTYLLPYNTLSHMEKYLDKLKQYKKKELAIIFFETIGVDVRKEKSKRYTDDLDEDFSGFIDNYFGGFTWMFKKNNCNGITAWIEGDDDHKISFLNYIRDNEYKPISKDEFEEFCSTHEYSRIMDKIKKYIQIYESLEKEYQDYVETLLPYQNFVDDERKRRNILENEYLGKLLNYLKCGVIPTATLEKLKNDTNALEKFFGEVGIDSKTFFEYFSKEDETIIKDNSSSDLEKRKILTFRLKYLQNIGVVPKDIELGDNYMLMYNNIVSKDDVKPHIPTQQNASSTTRIRKLFLEQFEEKFMLENPYYKRYYKYFSDNDNNKKVINNNIINNKVCLSYCVEKSRQIMVIFIRPSWKKAGGLDYLLCHELWHVAESWIDYTSINKYGCGFEDFNDDEKNPYNDKKRKYEIMNEIIDDLLCQEAVRILHDKGIFIMEPKEISDLDVSDQNTRKIEKELLKPFLSKYRKLIIKARFTGNKKPLFDAIGRSNYEELNDIVNKVHSLREALLEKRGEGKVDKELIKQLERLDGVYTDMQEYKSGWAY